MIYLASNKSNDPVMVREIADSYSIPTPFLAKLTQTLAKHHLLETTRGRGGGIKLSRPATTIFLPEVIHAIDGPPLEEEPCVFGLDICSDEQPCPLHHKWKPIREEVRSMLASENLAMLAKRVNAKRKLMNGL